MTSLVGGPDPLQKVGGGVWGTPPPLDMCDDPVIKPWGCLGQGEGGVPLGVGPLAAEALLCGRNKTIEHTAEQCIRSMPLLRGYTLEMLNS